jgi:hypothetical protein
VRRLRKHLIVILRELRMIKDPQHSVSPLRPEPEGFAARADTYRLFSLQGVVLYQRSGSCISGSRNDFACAPPAHGAWRKVETAMAALDVPAGESWAFRDHRTMAQVIADEAAPAAEQAA